MLDRPNVLRWLTNLGKVLICVFFAIEASAACNSPLSPSPNDELLKLGKMLFFDARLSADGTISCASCHRPELAFADGRPRAIGIAGRIGTRNTPSLLNVALEKTLFWDGRSPSLTDQAIRSLLNPLEHGLENGQIIEHIVSQNPIYADGFRRLLGKVSLQGIAAALSAFEMTLTTSDSAFDRYFYRNERGALTESAERGLSLFRGKARCAECHLIAGEYARFTDDSFHFSPLRLSEKANQRLSAMSVRLARLLDSGQRSQAEAQIASDANVASLGRFLVTGRPEDIGSFKTPSLRNVALTAPYMHDGSVPTLANVIEMELYAHDDALHSPIILSPLDKQDLEEFLKALSSTPQLSDGSNDIPCAPQRPSQAKS